jgi:putative phosphoribosyl transferase
MRMQFRDRKEAGKLLAEQLSRYKNRPEVLVLALPRGGVPVAYEVARALGLPLDVFVVRKLGVPGQEELAMGAIASGGVRVLNEPLIARAQISKTTIEAVTAREQRELERRERLFRDDLPLITVEGKTVIIVDDGMATGSTMRAAVKALRAFGAAKVVVAVPTAALAVVREMRREVDGLVAVMTPADFVAVGEWYSDFPQTSDEEVKELLIKANPSAASSRAM